MACAHQTVKRIGQMIRCFGNRIAMCVCHVCVCLVCGCLVCGWARDIHVCLFGSLNHVYDCFRRWAIDFHKHQNTPLLDKRHSQPLEEHDGMPSCMMGVPRLVFFLSAVCGCGYPLA